MFALEHSVLFHRSDIAQIHLPVAPKLDLDIEESSAIGV
jgi:hypothetical protein